MSLDEDLYRAINGAGNVYADVPMVILSFAGAAYTLVAVPPILWWLGARRVAVDYLILFILVEATSLALKLLLQVPRPTPFRPVSWVPAPLDAAFPSSHAARAFALAALLGSRWAAGRGPLLALAAAVALSRTYLGVHLPSEVAAGAALGLGVACGLMGLQGRPAYRRMRGAFMAALEALSAKLFQGPQGAQDLAQGGQGCRDVPRQGGPEWSHGHKEGVAFKVENHDDAVLRSRHDAGRGPAPKLPVYYLGGAHEGGRHGCEVLFIDLGVRLDGDGYAGLGDHCAHLGTVTEIEVPEDPLELVQGGHGCGWPVKGLKTSVAVIVEERPPSARILPRRP